MALCAGLDGGHLQIVGVIMALWLQFPRDARDLFTEGGNSRVAVGCAVPEGGQR